MASDELPTTADDPNAKRDRRVCGPNTKLLTAVVLLALTAARWAYSIATDAATTRRSRLFFRKRAAVENTPLRERTGGTRASGAGSQVWT